MHMACLVERLLDGKQSVPNIEKQKILSVGSMVSIVICVGVFVWMNKHTEKYMERT